MDDRHAVTLPHPVRVGTTTGTCACGWTITYLWGRHGDAVYEAREHIHEAAHAHAAEVWEMSGEITVLEGVSL